MIAKGFDLPGVTLVGVLNTDAGLHIPDFRGHERLFQLLVQAAGRAGRHKNGEVFLQSMQPEHPVIQFASRYDYSGFIDYEIAQDRRQAFSIYANGKDLAYRCRRPIAHQGCNKTKRPNQITRCSRRTVCL